MDQNTFGNIAFSRHYIVDERALDRQRALLLVLAIAAAVSLFAAFAGLTVAWRAEQGRRAELAQLPETLLCFDGQGQVTRGDSFAECVRVKYYPPKRP